MASHLLILKKINQLKEYILGLIMPSKCVICNKIIASGYFCLEHFNKINFIYKPHCAICCHDFEFEIGKDDLCAKCIKERPKYDKALAVMKYDDITKKMIWDFKYCDKSYLAKFFADLIFNRSQEILPKIDLIMAIPIHKKRLISRKYNHVILIAKILSKKAKITLLYDTLKRKKNTKPQHLFSAKNRQKNIAGAFMINEKYLNKIKDKNILLIDDVMTSGATINEASKILKKFGAKKVYVSCLAKTIIK